MSYRIRVCLVGIVMALQLVAPAALLAEPVSYQGRLMQQGQPFTGTADLIFRLYDSLEGGSVLGNVSKPGQDVENGLFQAELDFGPGIFDGGARYLAIAVNGQVMSPRQPLRPAPTAMYAHTAGAGPHWQIDGADIHYIAGRVGIGIPSADAVLKVAGSGSFGDPGNELTGPNGFIAGGIGNRVSNVNSFAGGVGARAVHPATFVWVSGSNPENLFTSTEKYQFLVSSNRIGFGTNAPHDYFEVDFGLPEEPGNYELGAFRVRLSGETRFRVLRNGGVGIGGSFNQSGVPDRGLRVHGDTQIGGNLNVTGTKNFRIDHPLDPENRFLLHFASEGPEPFNVYAGNILLDDDGRAEVELPDWFEAINIDFRYQLTPIGAPAPELHVAERIRDNRFAIAGGSAGLEVSWEVRARRNDPTIRRLQPVADVDKPSHLRGQYLDPLAWERTVLGTARPTPSAAP